MSDKTKPQVDPEPETDAKAERAGPAGKSATKSGSRTAAKPTGKSAGKGSGSSSASKSAFVSGGKRPTGKGASGRRPIKPVKVASDKPWGTIAMFAAVGVAFVAIVGYTGYQAWYNAKSPQEQALLISGVTDLSKKVGKSGQHDPKDLTYDVSPPVGGPHNQNWQNCTGDVYDGQIADEHAVHSLEHGAIWITYRPDLAKAEVDKLAERVRGKDYMLMSQYPNLDSPISLQAWGYRLKLDSADDGRIDDFIKALRTNGPEKGAACSGGITVTGDKPREVPPPQGGQPGGAGQPGAPQPGGGQPVPPQPGS